MKTAADCSLEAIARIRDHQSRGFKFQEALRRMLIISRFEVVSNPGVARPRQTDLFASRDDRDYLIEAKWQSKAITSADVDDLRARLRRGPHGLIGCIFSMSNYAATAIEAVEAERSMPILLFSPSEIHELARDGRDLNAILHIKRKKLMIDGMVWFLDQKERMPQQLMFPKCSRSIAVDGSRIPCCVNPNSDINDVMFAADIADVGHGTLCGNGVAINIRFPVLTVGDFRRIIALLHNQIGFSSEGSFSIRQLDCSWQGYGVTNFLSQIPKWKQRYKAAQLKRVHHSEDLHYFDSCDFGLCHFSARQRVNHKTSYPIDFCELEVHLPGIPVNMKPFARVSEEARSGDQFFVPFAKEQLEHVRLNAPIRIEPIAEIVRNVYKKEQTVCGLVVKNPFKDSSLIPKSDLPYSALNALGTQDKLMCELSDWHDLGDVIDYYFISSVEAIHVDQTTVFRCTGTWHSILKRARSYAKKGNIKKITTAMLRKYGAKLPD